MSIPKLAAVLVLLACFVQVTASRASLPANLTARWQNGYRSAPMAKPGTTSAIAAVINHTIDRPARTAYTVELTTRGHLMRWLGTPDVAAILTGAGILLLFAECNLPGAILPGATGLLLLLSGIYGFTLQPLRPSALVLLAVASTILAASAQSARAGTVSNLAGLAGSLGLSWGLGTLVRVSPTGVDPAVAVSVGASVGLAALFLGRIAVKARRNKAVMLAGT